MNHKRNQGFTLIEIAIVVFVIGVIASITIIAFNQVQKDSRDQKRTSDALAIKNALSHYYSDNNEYPSCTNTGWGCDMEVLRPVLVPKYMQDIPRAPKDQPYYYAPGYFTNAYGLLVEYEGPTGSCKTGVNMDAGWWYSAPACPQPL